MVPLLVCAQVEVILTDSLTGERIGDVSVLALETGQGGISNPQGVARLNLATGAYTLDITHLSYREVLLPVEIKNAQQIIAVRLVQQTQVIEEVVVTASESQGASSASVVGKEAMQHLQPSSFADIVSMLPGASTQAPNLTSANTIKLREASNGSTNSDYDAASLGTSFVVDGAPISTDANMQYVQGGSSGQDDQRQVVNKGVDMRTISTDDIEKVEIIRGIAGAEYGDVTSGVVKIERTMKPTPWRARFKADGFSKLFYVGKGVGWNNDRTVLNVGVDYLNAKNDPTNTLENYQRITASVRLQNRWRVDDTNIRWQNCLDYTGSIDNDKLDPDINHNKEDSYRSEYHLMKWCNTVNISNKSQQFWSFALTANISYSLDRIRQTKFTQLTTPISPPLTICRRATPMWAYCRTSTSRTTSWTANR